MTKLLITLTLLAALIVPGKTVSASDWTGKIEQALKSVVFIETDEGTCTGFVVDVTRKYVQTAAHCDGDKVWIDRVVAKIVSKDTKKDLAVFEVKDLDPTRPALKLAVKDPEIGQEVMSIGYGMGLERPLFRKAMVSDTALTIPEGNIGGPFIALDSAFVGGQSGGPVINHEGEVVMIVQRASGTTGIGVAASIIRERVGRFWGSK